VESTLPYLVEQLGQIVRVVLAAGLEPCALASLHPGSLIDGAEGPADARLRLVPLAEI
jgi:hypothetical protein